MKYRLFRRCCDTNHVTTVVVLADSLRMVLAFVMMKLQMVVGLVRLLFTKLMGSPTFFYEEIPIYFNKNIRESIKFKWDTLPLFL